MSEQTDFAVFLDSSALTKLVIEEHESAALGDFVGDRLPVSSTVALTEVPRAVRKVAARAGVPVPLHDVMQRIDELFDGFGFVTTDAEIIMRSAMLDPPTLRSLDSIHIATALVLGFDEFVTYDARQAEAARQAGLLPVAPGT